MGEAEGDMGAECSRGQCAADEAITPLLPFFVKSQQEGMRAFSRKIARQNLSAESLVALIRSRTVSCAATTRDSQNQLRAFGDVGAAGAAGAAGFAELGGFVAAGSMPLGARIVSGASVSTATVV